MNLKQNASTIADLVYERTFCPSGRYHHYLSIVELQYLLEQIISSGETAACVQAIPFFRTVRGQEEFDDLMLFVKRLHEGETPEQFYASCVCEAECEPSSGVTRCYATGDLAAFQDALREYIACLPTLTQQIYAFLKERCQIDGAELLMGSLCFEVNAD